MFWRWLGRRTATYHVQIGDGGRAGVVRYSEVGGSLEFWREFTEGGAAIAVLDPAQWDAAHQAAAVWAVGRREEILRRLAREVRRQRAPAARISIEDRWIVLTL